MRDYTYKEIIQMQEQAVARVKEMQRQAKLTAASANTELSKEQANNTKEETQEIMKPSEENKEMDNSHSSNYSSFEQPQITSKNEKEDNKPTIQKSCTPPLKEGAKAVTNPIRMPVEFPLRSTNTVKHTEEFAISDKEKIAPETKSTNSILDNFKLDSDQFLILALALLLAEEHKDNSIVLALLYILL